VKGRRRRLRTAEVVEAFIVSRRASGCSRKYEEWLRYVFGWLLRRWSLMPTEPEQLEAVLADARGKSDATRRDIYSGLRMLFLWAEERRGVVNVMRKVRKPRREKKRVVRTLTKVQVEQVRWARGNRRLRERALLLLLLDTGVRIGEAWRVTLRDLDVDVEGGGVLCVDGKVGERNVPVSPETVHALRELAESGGLPWRGARGALTLNGLQDVVQRALARSGLKGGPHLLRHTFGRLYVLNGGDLFSLQRIMGHEQISTTRVYVDLDDRDVRAQHARFSPIAQRAAAQ